MRIPIEILIALKKYGTSTPRQVAANCHFVSETVYGHLKTLAEEGHAKVYLEPLAYTITKKGISMLRTERKRLLADAARLTEITR